MNKFHLPGQCQSWRQRCHRDYRHLVGQRQCRNILLTDLFLYLDHSLEHHIHYPAPVNEQ